MSCSSLDHAAGVSTCEPLCKVVMALKSNVASQRSFPPDRAGGGVNCISDFQSAVLSQLIHLFSFGFPSNWRSMNLSQVWHVQRVAL
jgi:hypothetical protein